MVPYHKAQCWDGNAFRMKYLHNTIIDNLMHVNRRGLESIFVKMASSTKGRTFTLNSCYLVER